MKRALVFSENQANPGISVKVKNVPASLLGHLPSCIGVTSLTSEAAEVWIPGLSQNSGKLNFYSKAANQLLNQTTGKERSLSTRYPILPDYFGSFVSPFLRTQDPALSRQKGRFHPLCTITSR